MIKDEDQEVWLWSDGNVHHSRGNGYLGPGRKGLLHGEADSRHPPHCRVQAGWDRYRNAGVQEIMRFIVGREIDGTSV